MVNVAATFFSRANFCLCTIGMILCAMHVEEGDAKTSQSLSVQHKQTDTTTLRFF